MNLKTLQQHIVDLERSDLPQALAHHIKQASGVIILGNGGSNSIASHIAEDYTKVLKIPCLTFSDAPLITCYANDFGYENCLEQFLKSYYRHQVIILISSSGASLNILNAAKFCKSINAPLITLSGFKKENELNSLYSSHSLLNYWVDSNNYGIVENMHQIFLHSIL